MSLVCNGIHGVGVLVLPDGVAPDGVSRGIGDLVLIQRRDAPSGLLEWPLCRGYA
jgi:hypothetical protein